jgi:hypothetical protein
VRRERAPAHRHDDGEPSAHVADRSPGVFNATVVWMKLILKLAAWAAFMIFLLFVVSGFGVGSVELIVWTVVLVVGWALLVRSNRAHRTAV